MKCSPIEQQKREFVRKWAKGLELVYNNSSSSICSVDMGGMAERNYKAGIIKVSADVAMASTRIHTPYTWGRALIADAYSSTHLTTKLVAKHVLLRDYIITNINHNHNAAARIPSSKKILRRRRWRRRCGVSRRRSLVATTSSAIAKRLMLIKRRRELLKSLVPGAKSIPDNDDVSLIREALDYVVSLQLQVHVMRTLANVHQS